jgi:hypothetical protein
MALSRGDQHGQRPAVPVDRDMDLGREPASAAPERLAVGRFDRLV